MPVDYNVLIAYGGVAKKVTKGEILFREGGMPYYYYQVVEGEVKMFSTNEYGKELIQGTFTDGQSFGEPALLLDRTYPSTAQATRAGVIIKIRKESFIEILRDFPEIAFRFIYTFAERIYSKASSMQIWVGQTPEEKILRFFQNLKSQADFDTCQPLPYTRQQIADHTNLRTETVIRTLMRMAQEDKICIENHKIFLKS